MLLLTLAFTLSCIVVIPESRSAKLMVQRPEEQLRLAMAEVKTIGMAMETYYVDYNRYPAVDCAQPKYGIPGLCAVEDSREVLKSYIHILPALDPWGSPYYFWVSKSGLHYAVISLGSDMKMDDKEAFMHSLETIEAPNPKLARQTNPCTSDEIILADGQFLQWPANQTRECR